MQTFVAKRQEGKELEASSIVPKHPFILGLFHLFSLQHLHPTSRQAIQTF
jgi:hypothetical protein